MKIKWTFLSRGKEIAYCVDSEEEDRRIQDAVDTYIDLLYLGCKDMDAYINLHQCSLIVRHELKDTDPCS